MWCVFLLPLPNGAHVISPICLPKEHKFCIDETGRFADDKIKDHDREKV